MKKLTGTIEEFIDVIGIKLHPYQIELLKNGQRLRIPTRTSRRPYFGKCKNIFPACMQIAFKSFNETIKEVIIDE